MYSVSQNPISFWYVPTNLVTSTLFFLIFVNLVIDYLSRVLHNPVVSQQIEEFPAFYGV